MAEAILERQDIYAPLTLVSGAWSPVNAQFATNRPIETTLSGPTVSLIGAVHLTGHSDVIILNIGGKITDIDVLRRGRLVLNPESTVVGAYHTVF